MKFSCMSAAELTCSRGLAILCGWTGGSLRNLRKHEEPWRRLGWATLSTPMSIDSTFFPPNRSGLASVAKELIQVVKKHRAARSDALVVSHCFSNGGVMLMLEMLRAHAQEQGTIGAASVSKLFDGAVYDSAPSREIQHWMAPVVIMTAGLPAAETAWQLAKHTPYALTNSLVAALLSGTHHRTSLLEPLGSFGDLRDANVNPPRAELCIYGDGDRLISPADVENFIQHRRQECGADMASCFCSGSSHVAHYRDHPRLYEQAIEALIAKLGGVEGTEGVSMEETPLPPGSRL